MCISKGKSFTEIFFYSLTQPTLNNTTQFKHKIQDTNIQTYNTETNKKEYPFNRVQAYGISI